MELLRQLFGPSQQDIWRQLADEVGGDFTQGDGFHRATRVEARVGQWTVTLDTFSVKGAVCTRLRAPYVNKDDFRFTIYRQGLFSELGKALGMQDITIGDADFDLQLIVKSNKSAKVRALLAREQLRSSILAQPSIFLEVRDDEGWFGTSFPDGVDELYFAAPGVIKHVDRLRRLYELFADVLDALCRMGSAYEHEPPIALR